VRHFTQAFRLPNNNFDTDNFMASNVPTIRQIAWLSVIPQVAVIGIIIYGYHLANFSNPFIFGALTYSVFALILRNLIAKNHRQGMRLVKQQKFTEAIPFFEKSVDYFSKNTWVDNYRFLTLLSSSKMTYKEMGLCNIAFCYSQTGNGQRAIDYYKKALNENAENGLAIAGLKMLSSVDTKTQLSD
jgi:tetratricopeptide (TPR) repeat protein